MENSTAGFLSLKVGQMAFDVTIDSYEATRTFRRRNVSGSAPGCAAQHSRSRSATAAAKPGTRLTSTPWPTPSAKSPSRKCSWRIA
jgi:hypothetical protein